MPCYHPITAYKAANQSKLVFSDTKSVRNKGIDVSHSLQIPCGQCIGCRLEKSRQWAMRCMHEAQMHEHNCFITLTYDDTHLPSDQSLHHKDFQLFVKRLRKKLRTTKVRYYMAGEYGENFGRPHFHACLFGIDFHDKKLWKRTSSGCLIYRSEDLEKLWPFGYSSIGDVNFESAAYVARYIMKKVNKKLITNDYGELVDVRDYHYLKPDLETGELKVSTAEYNKMSLKPGIGAEWYKKYRSDVYPHDYVVIRGKKVKPPKYYDNQYKNENPYEFDELLYKREQRAKLNFEDNTWERLAVKEQVTQAKLQKLKRTLT